MTNHPWLIGIGCAVLAIFGLSLWAQWVQDNKRARLAGRPPVRFRTVLGDIGIEIVGSIAAGVWGVMLKWTDGLLRPFRAWVAYRASFPFRDVLGSWPKVRHIAPGVLVMKAPHIGPRRVQSFSGWKPPVFTGIGLAVLNWVAFHRIAPSPEDALGASAGIAVYTCLISIPFWRMARKTRLVIRFDQGVISWKGPDKLRHVVRPEEPRSLQVIVPHRWANEERNKHDNWMRSHPNQPGPKPLFQISSELVMNTGPGGGQWRTVAEFCNDGSGQEAHRLQSAIDFVTDRAAEELATLLRAAAE